LLLVLGSDFSSNSEETSVTVEHMRGGSQTVEPISNYENGPAAPSIRGFTTGKSFPRVTADFKDTIYLYTNIGSPNRRPFWKVHGTVGNVTVNNGTDPEFTTVTLESVARGSTVVARNADDSTSGSGEAYTKLTITGSLGSTPGTFTCAQNCGESTVTDRSSADWADTYVEFTGNQPDFKSGTWTFQPRNDDYKALHDRPQDETYLYFGIWAREPKEADGTPAFKWIAGGGRSISASAFTAGTAALKGRAKFVGGAIGQYAIDKTDSGGQADIGTFTANATFDASFDVAGSDNDFKLSGNISNFRKMEDDSVLSGALFLGKTGDTNPPADLTGEGVTTTAGAQGVSGTIAGVKVEGSWEAGIYGVNNEAPPTGVTCPNGCAADVAGITGWFNAGDDTNAGAAEHDVVTIGGAFGAAKQ